MARKLREITEGAMYHTFSRIINKEALMRPKKIKYLMELVLKMALEKYDFELNGYALMDDHFHYLITTIAGQANISTIMQFIKSQFAQRYNEMMNRSGPVWNERFGSKIIENSEEPNYYCNWLCMYIFYNPVRKGYVENPRDYEFSCMDFYLKENYEPKLKLTLSKYFLELGVSFKERVKKFLEFETLYVEAKIKDLVPA